MSKQLKSAIVMLQYIPFHFLEILSATLNFKLKSHNMPWFPRALSITLRPHRVSWRSRELHAMAKSKSRVVCSGSLRAPEVPINRKKKGQKLRSIKSRVAIKVTRLPLNFIFYSSTRFVLQDSRPWDISQKRFWLLRLRFLYFTSPFLAQLLSLGVLSQSACEKAKCSQTLLEIQVHFGELSFYCELHKVKKRSRFQTIVSPGNCLKVGFVGELRQKFYFNLGHLVLYYYFYPILILLVLLINTCFFGIYIFTNIIMIFLSII